MNAPSIIWSMVACWAVLAGAMSGRAQDPDQSLATGSIDPDLGNEVSAGSHSISGILGADENCETIGAFTTAFQFPNRYRGNLYRISDSGFAIREIKMALAFNGTADLYASVHRKEMDGTYSEIDINADAGLAHVLIADAAGLGNNNVQYYSTGPIGGGAGVSLPPGDYAIGFGWGPESVKYARDSGVSYPRAFPAGLILASVSRELMSGEPPVPATIPSLNEFTGGVYAMELCFEPAPCDCPPPPGPCFGPGACDEITGDCVFPQLAEGAACSADPLDPTCSFYTCDQNAACLRQCDENCLPFGGFNASFVFGNRYRGNLYQITSTGVTLREIGMELAFDDTADLFVSIHRKEVDGTYTQVDINSDPLLEYVLIANAQGAGIDSPRFYSTGLLRGGGVAVAPGDYAIGFAWGDPVIRFGRDFGVSYPDSFAFGSVLGSVSRNVSSAEPPLPHSLPPLAVFTSAAYRMELCFRLCGNGVLDGDEACDGAAVANCPSRVCNPDCTCSEVGAIPTISEWGLCVLTLMWLIAAKIMFNLKNLRSETHSFSA